MQFRINKLVVISFLILLVYSAFYIYWRNVVKLTSEYEIPGSQLNPAYSAYRFNQDEDVISIGVQPLYQPTGVIFEVVKRDNILKNMLSESGMKIEFYSFFKGDDVNHFLGLNMLDGGVGGDMPAITAASNFAVVAPILVQKGFDSIITRELMLISSFRGKKIGYPYGSISHYSLLSNLYSSEITESDVYLIPMEINKLSSALFNEEIDAFCAWEPAATEALIEYSGFIRNFQNPTSGFMYFNEAFSSKYSLETKYIIAAVIRAINWLKSDIENLLTASNWNLESSESFTGKKSILTVDELANLALRDILQLSGIPTINPEDLESKGKLFEEFQFLLKLKKIPKETEWAEVKSSFNLSLIKDVLAKRNTYMLDQYDY